MAKVPIIMTLAVLLIGPAGGVDAAPPVPASGVACKPAVPFADGLRLIKGVRVVVGKNGESDFAPLKLDATTKAYFKPGELFASINFGAASKVQIVSGPANVKLPYHASLAYEMFLTVQGSSTVVLPDGREQELTPGMLVVMEDMGSKTGHAGRTGPCGYVAFQLVPTTRLP